MECVRKPRHNYLVANNVQCSLVGLRTRSPRLSYCDAYTLGMMELELISGMSSYGWADDS